MLQPLCEDKSETTLPAYINQTGFYLVKFSKVCTVLATNFEHCLVEPLLNMSNMLV